MRTSTKDESELPSVATAQPPPPLLLGFSAALICNWPELIETLSWPLVMVTVTGPAPTLVPAVTVAVSVSYTHLTLPTSVTV